MTSPVLIVFAVVSLMAQSGASQSDALTRGLRDYCQFEDFHAECPDGEVIQMTHAQYGRMELGRCVEADLGFVGCSKDVLDLADRRCSGRQTCVVSIPDESFDRTRPCLAELKFYLQASYTCVKVETVQTSMCNTCDYVKLTRHSGVLPSLITERGRCGSPDCPWDIEVAPGQQINLTLTDFALSHTDPSSIPDTARAAGCRVYATVKEMPSGRHYTICGGNDRYRHAYLAQSHHIQVRVIGQSGNDQPGRFLLNYQAVGCADVRAPRGGWVTRIGNNAVIGCNNTRDSWRLKCKDSHWTGTTGNCSGVAVSSLKFGQLNVPNGLSIVIILTVAVSIGACILTAGLIVIRRSRPHPNPQYHPTAQYGDKHRDLMSPVPPPPHGELQKTYPTNPRNPQNTLRKNEYAHIWERPLPDQPNTVTMDLWNPAPEGSTINPYDGGSSGYAVYGGDLGTGTTPTCKLPPPAVPVTSHPTDNTDTRYYQLEPEGLMVE